MKNTHYPIYVAQEALYERDALTICQREDGLLSVSFSDQEIFLTELEWLYISSLLNPPEPVTTLFSFRLFGWSVGLCRGARWYGLSMKASGV